MGVQTGNEKGIGGYWQGSKVNGFFKKVWLWPRYTPPDEPDFNCDFNEDFLNPNDCDDI